MFRRAPKSSAAGPAFEPLPHAAVAAPEDESAEHLQEWRDAAKRVVRTYRAWGAASRSDRHDRYSTFLAALRREELAAQRVAHDASEPRRGSP